jgi:dipeptidyl aminopeptidase/acylaminoacyl peptidase
MNFFGDEAIMPDSKGKRQFGLWSSPITPITLAHGIAFSDITWDQSGTLVWREARGDRGVIVLQDADGQAPRDLNDDLSVRAKVGYGGGDFTCSHGHVYFSEAASGRLYRQPICHGTARPITPAFGMFASPTPSPDGNWLLFVHTYENCDSLGIIPVDGQEWPCKLVSGDDFYMQPAWHPDSNRIAWIAWNYPNMPWDGTFLRMAELDNIHGHHPTLNNISTIAGSENTSIFQPLFSPDGRYLAYVSDANGWWQVYLYDLETDDHRLLTTAAAEYGAPAWIQGMHTYGFSPDGSSLFVIQNLEGYSTCWMVDIHSGEMHRLDLGEDYTALDQIAVSPVKSHTGRSQIALIASGTSTPARIITFEVPHDRDQKTEMVDPEDLDSSTSDQTIDPDEPIAVSLPVNNLHIWRRSTAEDLPAEAYSPVESITWSGLDGDKVYGLFFQAHNPDFSGIGKPPLILSIHGGPTSQVRANFNPKAQFFATRGYAVLEVNYRGSTGYGRAYRDQLKGNWGIYDVQDAVAAARHLIDQEQVDGSRLIIMGGSAGGFTVLQALVDHPGFFKAGVCLYGVSNQFTLVADTHKFEARYSDSLLGSLPEAAAVYHARSPILNADKIRDPIILFQGEEDQVVPKAQSDSIVASLQQRGVPHEYHLYPGEGHGFRKAETIQHFYHAIDKFLKQYVIYT